MLRLGVIGLNEGNGHPYSFSAVFNGYNEAALDAECPFEIIRKYLKTHHRNREFVTGVRVTHVWTQNRELSERVARVSNIEHVVDRAEEMIGQVDGVIFARDDIWNHWEMAKPFLEARLPIYMDKVMGHNLETLDKFVEATGAEYPIMTASSFRFAPEVEKAREMLDLTKVKTIHAISPCVWIRYAAHLLDPICSLFGYDIDRVQNLGREKNDSVFIRYTSSLTVIAQVIENVSLPLEFRCFSGKDIPPYCVQYTDPTLESYFMSIVRMMQTFASKIVDNDFTKNEFENSVKLNRLIIEAERSREDNGRPVEFSAVTGI
jgi:predicted dehydrogenase